MPKAQETMLSGHALDMLYQRLHQNPKPYLKSKCQVEREAAAKSLHQRITTLTLMQRIENPPLATHLSLPPPLLNLAPPVPTHIHFHKTKTLKRIEEYQILFEALKIRMDPVFIKLREEDMKETPFIPLERRDALWRWWKRFQDYYEKLETIGHTWSNSQWRQIKGACKHIGKVSTENLSTCLPVICEQLADIKRSIGSWLKLEEPRNITCT
ncbi:hypothetical protein AX16_002160 [Volvariella volvacea WC 439]|nr:hypothetical protein AX16_002160 [Volvariella volvacea WC 439]